MIRENPYLQYFLGLEAFTYDPVMTPSLLVSIRKRIDLDVFESLTDDLIKKGLKLKTGSKPDDDGMDVKDEEDNDREAPHPGNKGKHKQCIIFCFFGANNFTIPKKYAIFVILLKDGF